MYSGKYVPWDHFPKTLHFSEVQNPLQVIINFFSTDWPDGHRKQLKEWRRFVINDKSYNHKQEGPGMLLFIYDENLKMLEAMFLLLLDYQDNWSRSERITDKQLREEQEQWVYFPDNLSKNELIDPYLAVNKVFKKIKPQKFRDYLKAWVHNALYTFAADETLRACEIDLVYENMLKIYSAAWLVHQRKTEHVILRKDWHIEKIKEEAGEAGSLDAVKPNKSIPAINTELTPAGKLGLDEVVKFILKEVPPVKMIVHLGTQENPFTYYLLILIEDKSNIQEHEIISKLEDKCKPLIGVFTLVYKLKSAVKGITGGMRFWNTVMQSCAVAYQADDLILPPYQPISDKVILERAAYNWNRWGLQGRQFFEGAKRYREDENYILALFLLHQAAESTLLGIIKAILGYYPHVHDLSRMLKITMLFTGGLNDVFQLETELGARIFGVLQDAYSEARYKSDFVPDDHSVNLLIDRVDTFLEKAEAIYLDFISSKEAQV
jgi:HEPN domain-containing protein